LRGEISLKENFAGIVLLRDGENRCGEDKHNGEPTPPASHDTILEGDIKPPGERFPVHRR
jgi:hypothetical protein